MEHFAARDGQELAYRTLGDGRTLVLFHGFTGSGRDWFGPAAVFADHGHRVIVPDLRGHGASAAPRDAAAYPPDVLADDGLALLDHLGLDDYATADAPAAALPNGRFARVPGNHYTAMHCPELTTAMVEFLAQA